MNGKMKRRLAVATGIIAIALVAGLAVAGSAFAARTATVAQAVQGALGAAKLQVTGAVVPNSSSTGPDGVLRFSIYDEQVDPGAQVQLAVAYEGGTSATFGNGVVAICTGRLDDAGVLQCSELVTKCPSKYENAASALDINRLLDYGEGVVGKPVKVRGSVAEGSLSADGQGNRFDLTDDDRDRRLPVRYEGALSDDVGEGAAVVITGSLAADGSFLAAEVALDADAR